jgi:site-specific DNA-methyltransferase (adenine-specific)
VKPYYEHGGITIYHGDSRECLPALGTFDLLLTDPPYGINVTKHRTVGGGGATANGYRRWERSAWDAATSPDVLTEAIARCEHAIVWGGNYYALPPARCWLVWNKVQRGFSLADGELAWTTLQRAVRIIDCPRNPGFYRSQTHPTEKPLKVIQWCLSFAPRGTQTVLDPFMGSGTTLVAATRAGVSGVGIEAEERYCEIAAKRLQQEVLPLEQPA